MDNRFRSILDEVLGNIYNRSYTSAAAIVRNGDSWLFGLSNHENDRNGKWCFPGGSIKNNECAAEAAVRECREETGIKCTAVSNIPLTSSRWPNIAFIYCVAENDNLKPNNEFKDLMFLRLNEISKINIYERPYVEKLIKRCC
tara:strand:- start:1272 stop:1700 length:429 start_codon:yes stop_codon:yes gene_type:complete